MKKYKISSHYLNKCISIIEDNCYGPSGVFAGKALDEFCSNPKNVQALRLLEAAEEIRTDSSDGSARPYVVWLDNKGTLHLYTAREKRISTIKGFFIGVLSTLISTHLFSYLFSFLPF